MKRVSLLVLLLVSLIQMIFAGEKFTIDVAHSRIGFGVKHMVISTVEGNFRKFDGIIDFTENDLTQMKVNVKIDVSSINTGNEKRDGHLKSPDFFNVAKFPEAIFKSTRVIKNRDQYILIGNLTLKGVTREIEIPFQYNGKIKDPWGNIRIGFEGRTRINRKEFGINWSKTMDNGGLVVSDEVTLILHIEAVRVKK
jgi:polyisoprenoid-binding protein YceI